MTHSCVNLRSRVRCFSPAVWPPIRRAHEPRRPDGGGDREGEREHNAATAAADRVLPGRERPDGNWEGRREGRKEKRERKERRSLALLLRRRRRRPTGKTIINHIGFDRRRDGGSEALAAPGVAACSTEGRGDRRTGGHGGNRAVPRVGRSVRRCSAAALTYYSEGDADGKAGAKAHGT